jgi:hypothetical protein
MLGYMQIRIKQYTADEMKFMRISIYNITPNHRGISN